MPVGEIDSIKPRENDVEVTMTVQGVLDAQRNSASVMVYMNRTVTDKSRQPVYDGSRFARRL